VTDIVDAATRRRMMQGIRSRDTKPELLVRRGLHARGFRYVLGGRDLPGHPDLVFPSRASVVFVHGCFWHGHANCLKTKGGKAAKVPATNRSFWEEKCSTNRDRHSRQTRMLRRAGYRVLTVWGCDVQSAAKLERILVGFFNSPVRASKA